MSSTPVTNVPRDSQEAIALGFREHPLYKGFYANDANQIWSSKSKNLLSESANAKSRPRVTLRLSPSSFVGVQRHLFVAECHQSVGGAIHEISSTPLTNIPEIDGFLLTRSSAIAIGFKEHPSYKGFYADVNGSIWSEKACKLLGEDSRRRGKNDFVFRWTTGQVRIRRSIFATECHLTPEGGPPGFKRHPVYRDFYASSDGIVWSALSRQIVKGTRIQPGYIQIAIKHENAWKSIGAHRIVYEAFHGKVTPKTHEIDHINGNPSENQLQNLQALTKADHRRKTLRTAKSSGPSLSRRIRRFQLDGAGNRFDIAEYDSSVHAAKALGASRGNFNKVIRTGKCHLGYYWEYAPQLDLDDEVWKILKLEDSVVLVSSKGRICAHNNRKTFGSRNLSGYYQIRISGRSYQVHYLVCLAFHGPAPNGEDTVDHINQDRGCNHHTNLRWATRHMQNIYRHAIPVIAHNPDGSIFRSWLSMTEARKHFGITATTLTKAITRSTPIEGLSVAFGSK